MIIVSSLLIAGLSQEKLKMKIQEILRQSQDFPRTKKGRRSTAGNCQNHNPKFELKNRVMQCFPIKPLIKDYYLLTNADEVSLSWHLTEEEKRHIKVEARKIGRQESEIELFSKMN